MDLAADELERQASTIYGQKQELTRLVQEDRKDIERLTRQDEVHWKTRRSLLAEIDRLRAALEWYAKADYDLRISGDGDGYIDVWGGEEILKDKGKRAREAIAGSSPSTDGYLQVTKAADCKGEM